MRGGGDTAGTTPFGSSSFERSREAAVENAGVLGNPFSTSVLGRLEAPLEANGSGKE
jgi:hypothetical protein